MYEHLETLCFLHGYYVIALVNNIDMTSITIYTYICVYIHIQNPVKVNF